MLVTIRGHLCHFFQSLLVSSGTGSKTRSCAVSLSPSDKPMRLLTKIDNQKRELAKKDKSAKDTEVIMPKVKLGSPINVVEVIQGLF